MEESKLGSIIIILIRCISLFEIYLQNYLSFSGKKSFLMNLITIMVFLVVGCKRKPHKM